MSDYYDDDADKETSIPSICIDKKMEDETVEGINV
jgi:hypothetical protein